MKTKQYKQLTEHDRVRIEVYLREGTSQYEIANLLGVNRSTISREVKKRGGILRGYSAQYAQEDYQREKKQCGIRSKIETTPVGSFVIDRIKHGWSPQQIAGRLKKEIREGTRPQSEYVNHESIYQFIYESDYGKREKLFQYLRNGKKRRTKKYGRKTKHEIIPNRVFIDARPKEIESRKTLGHWEGDAIIYTDKQAIQSIVERKVRFTLLSKLERKTVEQSTNAFIIKLGTQYVKTLTVDNGIENKNHTEITRRLNAPVFFCHPYHSWEKGTNENTNGLVRRYLPHGSSLAEVTQQDLDDIAGELNSRPRKILSYATPQEMLELEYSKLSVVAVNS